MSASLVAVAVSASPRLAEVLFALVVAAFVAAFARLTVFERVHVADRTGAVAIVCGASFAPGILVARYVLLPTWDEVSLDGIPVALLVLLAGYAGVRVLSWAALTRAQRERRRRIGRVAFWAFWIPAWAYILAAIAGPAKIARDPALVFELAVIGALALLDAVVTPKLEDRLAPVEP
ncbi:MAG TPA: hypothetical protein VNS09_03605 [Solirubrobacter sp.]|nr:hypothetical protein [Solirubrobacter sp.]